MKKHFAFLTLATLSLSLMSSPKVNAAQFLDSEEYMPEISGLFTDVTLGARPAQDASAAALDAYDAELAATIFAYPHQIFNGNKSYLEGYTATDGSKYFGVNNSINRAEVSKIFSVFKELTTDFWGDKSACFTDVDSADWYAEYVCQLKKNGIIGGYPDGSYQGGNSVNNAEIAKFLVNNYDLADESINTNTSPWYQAYFDVLKEKNVLRDDVDPSAETTRGEMMGMILRAMTVADTGEAFSYYQLNRFLENLMEDGREEAYLLDGVYEEESTFRFGTVNVVGGATSETVSILNNSSSTADLEGYTVRVLDDDSSDGWAYNDLVYKFTDSTEVAAGASVNVTSKGGDYTFDYIGTSGYGAFNDIAGRYLFLLYNANDVLVDSFALKIP